MKKSKQKIISRKRSIVGTKGAKSSWNPETHSLENLELRRDKMVYGSMRKRNIVLAELRVVKKYGQKRGQELISAWEERYKEMKSS